MKKIIVCFLLLVAIVAQSHPVITPSQSSVTAQAQTAFGVDALSGFCLGPVGWALCNNTFMSQAIAYVDGPITVTNLTCCGYQSPAFETGDSISMCVAEGDGDSSDPPTSIAGTCVTFDSGDAAGAFVCKSVSPFATFTGTDYQLALKADNIVDAPTAGSENIRIGCTVRWLSH